MNEVASRKLRLKLRWIIGVAAAFVVIAGFWPTTYLASPRWEVWVVTEDDKPLPRANVYLVYENYSAEDTLHQVNLTADENGYAVFPPNYGRTFFFQRVFYTLSSARATVHASFGRHASVWAAGNGRKGDATTGRFITDWQGSPKVMQSRIVAKPTTGGPPKP